VQDELLAELKRVTGINVEVEDHLSHPPVAGTIRAFVAGGGRRLTIAYVALDSYPPTDFWTGKGTRRSFADEASRNEFVATRRKHGRLFAGLSQKEDGNWKSEPYDGHLEILAPTAIKGRTPRQDEAAFFERCDRLLRSHAAWLAGETYGVVVETFSIDDDRGLNQIDVATHWPHADRDTALAMRDDLAGSPSKEPATPECPAFQI
jgi:hypothetical protein